MTTAQQQIEISSSVERFQHDGHMTAGYVIRNWQNMPVFIGTFNECANLVSQHHGTIRDARGFRTTTA